MISYGFESKRNSRECLLPLNLFLSFLDDKERKKIGSKENTILEFYQQFSCVNGDRDFEDVWTKMSIIEHLAKLREFDLENSVMEETSKTMDPVD